MRGEDERQDGVFRYVSPEKRVHQDHPCGPSAFLVDQAVKEMSPRFARPYAQVGRPPIAPERLLPALLLQIFHSARSERLLMEQLDYKPLFRWFVGMQMDEAVCNHAVFSKNREQLLNEEMAEAFFQRAAGGCALSVGRALHRGRHFDRSLGEPQELSAQRPGAWGEHRRRSKPSRRDPPQRHAPIHHWSRGAAVKKSKGSEAQLSYLGHVLIENRNGLLVQTVVTPADGTTERHAALLMTEKIPGMQRVILGADEAYDTRDLLHGLRRMHITPHVAQNNMNRSSAIDQRATRQAGYAISQRKRWLGSRLRLERRFSGVLPVSLK